MKLVINLPLLASHCDVEIITNNNGEKLRVYSNGRRTDLSVKGITTDGLSTVCKYSDGAFHALRHLVGKGVNSQIVPMRNIITY
ncbi:MAG: hypothetical protein AXW14_08530 [Alteromonas sp. Nap_26]|nr:MAG: hypothetical protein AXW14_08530 [Alteromonas sp. Nap_26]